MHLTQCCEAWMDSCDDVRPHKLLSIWTLRSQTDETGRITVLPLQTGPAGIWCRRRWDEQHRISVLLGLNCSRLALIYDDTSSMQAEILPCKLTVSRGRQSSYTDCHQCTRVVVTDSILSVAAHQQHTGERGSVPGLIAMTFHTEPMIKSTWLSKCGRMCGRWGSKWTSGYWPRRDHKTSAAVEVMSRDRRIWCRQRQYRPSSTKNQRNNKPADRKPVTDLLALEESYR